MSTDDISDDEPQTITSDIGKWAMVPAWVRQALTDGKVDAMAVVVYCLLAEDADHGGDRHDFRSVALMAKELGVDPGTVRRALTKLREVGAIDWVQRVRANGSKSTNDYTVRFAIPIFPERPARVGAPTIAHQRTIPKVRASTRDAGSRTSARAYSDLDLKGSSQTSSQKPQRAAAQARGDELVGRDGEPQSARSVERAEPDRAREVVDFAWARRKEAGKALPTVRSGSPYMALVAVTRKLLEAGHDAELIALTFFDHEAAWTNDALLVTLSKVKRGSVSDPKMAAALHDRAVMAEVERIRSRRND